MSVSDNPRYLVSRPLADPRRGALGLLGRVLTRRPPFDERLHPVPADLARRKERAEAFARAWRRHVGPGRLVFTQRTDEGREARAEAACVGRRLRDAGPRRLGLSQRVLGRVLAVLGGAVGGVGGGARGRAASAPSASLASSAASRQASSTGLHSGARRRTISSVSGTSSRRDLRSAWLMAREGDSR